ncbi:MAG: inorganic diphosphatase [bacterium]|nr:inorganic diphosphatase [bacterium]
MDIAEKPATKYLHLPLGKNPPDEINVVVEIPAGSRNKYEYDKKNDVFHLDRALHSAMYYPGDYGFAPQTLAHDGDPLDVLVLVVEPTFSGCLIAARPVGMLEMIDSGKEDEKIIAVPVGEPIFEEVHSYTDLYPHLLRKISNFFEIYKALEGKTTKIGSWRDAAAAKRVLTESHERFHSI